MNRRVAVGVAALLLVAGTVVAARPTLAQTAATVDVQVTVGVDGYIDPARSTTASVSITSQTLLVGTVRASLGGRSFSTSIEVPANSTKVYQLTVGRPGNARRLTVSVIPDGAAAAISSERFDLRVPQQALVGLVDVADAAGELSDAVTTPFARDIVPLELTRAVLDSDYSVLPYLAISTTAAAAVSETQAADLSRWVNDGGRLVASAAATSSLGLAAAPSESLGQGLSVVAIGGGEAVIVDPGSLTAEQWSAVVRDVPLPMENTFFDESGFELISAAASAGSSVPDLPWLLGFLFVYVLLAGPINFFVLNRLGRRDLAWVSIPAISAVAVLAIWLVGRGQVDSQQVAHASVVTQDSEVTAGVTGLVVLPGTPGEHELTTNPQLSLTANAFGFDGALNTETLPDGSTRVVMDVPSAGAAPFEGQWQPDPLALGVSVAPQEQGLDVAITNNTDAEFWAWGAGSGGSVVLHPDPLTPGSQQQVSVRGVRILNPWEQPLQQVVDRVAQRRGFEQEVWATLWPLTNTASNTARDILTTRPYLFAFTDEVGPELTLDGDRIEAIGTTLVIVPLPGRIGSLVDVLDVVGADFVDRGPGFIFASNPDEIQVRFITEPTGTSFRVNADQFGFDANRAAQTLRVYDWTEREFSVFGPNDQIPLDYVSASGEVMVGIQLDDRTDVEINTNSFRIVWDGA